MKIRLTREFSFEMAHALEGYDGLCRHVHGHSYKMFVTVMGEPNTNQNDPKYGMVMDFTELKAIVNRLIVDRFDHALVLRDSQSNRAVLEALPQSWERVELTRYQPTCENMIIDFAAMIQRELPVSVELVELKLHETEKSSATWRACDQI